MSCRAINKLIHAVAPPANTLPKAMVATSTFPVNDGRKILDSADEKWQGSGSLLPEKLNNAQELTLRSQSFALYESSGQ